MLPPFIIDQIRQREQERHEEARPRLEIPMPPLLPAIGEPGATGFDDVMISEVPTAEDANRGVVIIDLFNL